VGQEAACLVADLSNLVFLFFLAFQRIAEIDSDFDLGSGFGSGSDWLVVDSASFAEYAVVEVYVVMEVVLVLALEDVQVDHVMIQVFLDQVVHAVRLVLVLAPVLDLVPVLDLDLVLVQAASASALDHAPATSKQSSCSVDFHLLDFPSMKRPW
jgi:hypothetical protein